MNWLERILNDRQKPSAGKDMPSEPSPVSPSQDAQAYINKVYKKIDALVSDFAKHKINSAQFQELYSHYQLEIQRVEAVAAVWPSEWKSVAREGESLVIRKQHMATAEAYAIYENDSGLPLATLGSFTLDPALVIPMLSSYHSATKEIFGAGMRLTEIEGGRRLCFIQGKYTTLLAIFNNEPIPSQLEYLDKLHRHFEGANQPLLTSQPIEVGKLIFPHQYFLGEWQK
ncbi:MAG TPA: hypothetical protein VHM28_01570 [Anaerolineales bacterium]|jgi:hypothetical protein|nr:hypothetical protein [Anaerolineales bacterium]